MYTLDTNVILYHLHDDERARGVMNSPMAHLMPLYNFNHHCYRTPAI
ncbi:MAG TPA: hypothetical protein VJG64_00820 [Candidatus Paceibacterota bacterium]